MGALITNKEDLYKRLKINQIGIDCNPENEIN
jgi:hypothetical protein